ncbi:MAG TPA: amidohydrolase family protein [Acidimicrobiia bacterium]|nr:amidohydrolase family protein [Acidimicrobiia bacterium]
MSGELGYAAFDADNHYYEALDAFTRHLDPALGPRTVQWAEIDGRKYHVVAGRVSHAVVNPTFDPIAKAGAMHDYFRGNPDGRNPLEFLREREPIRPEYRDRDARLAVMDEQGVAQIWLFPTLGILYEELLKEDPEAVALVFRSFNQWVEEDWGFAYRDRIFAAPYISLADVNAAVRELDWALERGARVVCMRPAAPTTVFGQLPPADPWFDPFWSRVNETGITVVVHAGDSGYSSQGYARDGFSATFGGSGRPSIKMLAIERAIYDFLASLIFDRLFTRFPNVRVASVENGSEFLPDLFRKLHSVSRKIPGFFPEDPVETFRRNIWINPFWEDDPYETVELMGADRVIFGSDWPHIEGMPEPLDYVRELKDFDDDTRRLIMRDNTRELNELRPA